MIIRRIPLLVLTLAASAATATAQTEIVVGNQRQDGTLWFQSLPPKVSAGSAQLASLDTGEPPLGLGLQAVWLEWTPSRLDAAAIGGGFTTVEVTTPAATPVAGLLGAATFNGGFILTLDDSGDLTDVRACVGSFLWTAGKLYLLAIGGDVLTVEVTTPGGASIADVQGVAVVASDIFDLDPTPETVEPHIIASAFVYTPTAVYQVDVDLSGGISYATAAVAQPPSTGGGPIAKTRGVSVVAGGFDFSSGLPVVHGAAFLWNDTRVFFLARTPALAVADVPVVPAGEAPQIWGVMSIAGNVGPPLRGAALIWRRNHAYLATFLPSLSVVEAPTATGGAIVSGVSVAPGPAKLPVQRQASYLYEIRARYRAPGAASTVSGHIVGQNQRAP